MALRIATFNVNSIKSRLDVVLDWLQRADIDILGMQELKLEEGRFPFAAFAELGYECAVFGQKAYNGVAICSRLPLEDVRPGFGDPELDQQRRIITARVGDLWLVDVYAPHGDARGGEKYFYKLEFYRRLEDYLRRSFSPKDRVCLMGDLNVAHRDEDVWDPELLRDSIGTMREEREAFGRLLDFGLYDVFRHLYPGTHKYTWWDYVGGAIWKDQGMRIDYLLVTRPLLPRSREVAIDLGPRRRRKPTPSDHAPVVLTLDVEPSPG
ncbi:MAG: exodeoxyribonuclease III [Firmicutes bacterium]|nr:exodeoxyribonuclease III [Bacillota bacterium]